MPTETTTKSITANGEQSTAAQLSDATGLSRTAIKDAMNKGAVWSNKSGRPRRLRRASSILKAGTEISIYYSPDLLRQVPPEPTLIEDQTHYSVWIKPAGILSGGSRFGDHCAIDRLVEKLVDRPTFLVHRLDRFVWGLMVLAHSKNAAAELSGQFQARETEKTYRAVVKGVIANPVTISEPIDDKAAVSHVTPIDHEDDCSLVEVRIETGRKHQIRKHLAGIGHPIIGDRQYGTADAEGIQLASTTLGFKNLDGETVRYQLPADLQPVLRT